IRRADRAGLHHPWRDLPLRTGGQRIRRGRHAPVAGLPDPDCQRHHHHRKRRAGHRPPDRKRHRCRPRCGGNGQPAGRAVMSENTPTPSSARPPKQARTGLKSTGTRKAASKSNRSRAREFALQALYQHLVGGNDAHAIDAFTRDLAGFHKADSVHYDALLHGCINTAADLDALITPLLDRKMAEISPIEHAVMWIGVYEFQHCLDVPWRVVLNECIELAKEFGGTDGHKYVNAVLNGLAPKLRALEVAADKAPGAIPGAPVDEAGAPPAERLARVQPTATHGAFFLEFPSNTRPARAGHLPMKFSTRAERIEPFYVMEVAKAAQALAREVAGTREPMI